MRVVRVRMRRVKGEEKEALNDKLLLCIFHNYGFSKHDSRKITSANASPLQLKSLRSCSCSLERTRGVHGLILHEIPEC